GSGLTFVFQAEDGIRDFHVTGVQTCALPISGRPFWHTGGCPVMIGFVLSSSRRKLVLGVLILGLAFMLPMVFGGKVNAFPLVPEIGRASCRERGSVAVVAGSVTCTSNVAMSA